MIRESKRPDLDRFPFRDLILLLLIMAAVFRYSLDGHRANILKGSVQWFRDMFYSEKADVGLGDFPRHSDRLTALLSSKSDLSLSVVSVAARMLSSGGNGKGDTSGQIPSLLPPPLSRPTCTGGVLLPSEPSACDPVFSGSTLLEYGQPILRQDLGMDDRGTPPT